MYDIDVIQTFSWFFMLSEMMFSAHIAIQYMFCMQLMIEKITLEGFTSTGEAKYGGESK